MYYLLAHDAQDAVSYGWINEVYELRDRLLEDLDDQQRAMYRTFWDVVYEAWDAAAKQE